MQKGLTPKGKIFTGYKATNNDLTCNGFKFEIGKWYEHDGMIELCNCGFHYCEHPSGPWSYYNNGRLFKIEAEFVLLSPYAPGTSLKHVSKRIRLLEEIYKDGKYNTGNRNTGNYNTGNRNTGDRNTGDGNAGGDNTGNRNTGDDNTGNRNTGNYNTGNYNIGNYNTGDCNTGYGNCGNSHSGSLCFGTPVFYLFNEIALKEKTNFTLVLDLAYLLTKDEDIDPTPFLSLPNASPEKIKALHEAHKKEREKRKEK